MVNAEEQVSGPLSAYLPTPPSAHPEPKQCYRCGAELPAGAKVCPECGRSQFRICYCDKEIPVNLPTCPYCGADWSQSSRVRKSRKRYSKIRPRELLRSAVIGAGIAVGITALVTIVVRYFAMVANGGAPPASGVLIQFRLAWQGVATVAAGLGAWLGTYRRAFITLGAILAVGGVAGASTYLIRKSALRFARAARHGSHERSSRRRSTSAK